MARYNQERIYYFDNHPAANQWAQDKELGKAWADPELPQYEVYRMHNEQGHGETGAPELILEQVKSALEPQITKGRRRTVPAETLTINNPVGLTGIHGRGVLGLYGPNPAADPVVFRVQDGKLKVLLVKRIDDDVWAIPGGMFDPTDSSISGAALRELEEETGLNFGGIKEKIIRLGEIYRGYSDDVRNTDNAWVVTTAFVFLVPEDILKTQRVKASDDATAAEWVAVDDFLSGEKRLFANHNELVGLGIKKLLENYEQALAALTQASASNK